MQMTDQHFFVLNICTELFLKNSLKRKGWKCQFDETWINDISIFCWKKSSKLLFLDNNLNRGIWKSYSKISYAVCLMKQK